MPFVDGEPIDAAKLGALETKINKLQSSIPTFGPGAINIDASTINSGPQIQAGTSDPVTISGPKIEHTIKFKFPFKSPPTVVACLQGGLTTNIISIRVAPGVSATGFTCFISAPTTAVGTKISINFIAISP